MVKWIVGAWGGQQAGFHCKLLIINSFFPQIVNISGKHLLMRFCYICPFRKMGKAPGLLKK